MRAGRKLAGTRDPPWLGFANESKIPASIIASLLFYTREYFAPVDKEPPVLSPHSPRTHARVHRVLPVARAHTLPVVISLSLPPYLSLERAATLFRRPRLVATSPCPPSLSLLRHVRSITLRFYLFVVRPAASLSLSLPFSFARDPDSGFSWQLTVARDARLSLSLSLSPFSPVSRSQTVVGSLPRAC